MKPSRIFGVSLWFMLGLGLTSAACSIEFDAERPPNSWPYFILASYALIPFPKFLARRMRGGTEVAEFATGSLIVAGATLPLVFFLSGVLTFGAMALATLGGAVVYTAVGMYMTIFR